MIDNFENDTWLIAYIFWELNLIRELGFGFEFDKTRSNKRLILHKIDNLNYEIPKFIINNEIPETLSEQEINKSLIFTRNILLNKFYLPNNLFLPKPRIVFENYFN